MRDRSFVAVCALILVNQIGFGLIVPVLPAYAHSFGLGTASIGFVIGIYGFARFIANVPAGTIADRRGRRSVLIIGTAITAVASALIATASTLPELLAYRLLAGIGAATVITGGQIMVGDIATPANRGRMMSIYQGVFLIGVGLGPTPGGLLADHFGVRAPFIAYAVFSGLACVVAMFLIRETRPTAADHAAMAKIAETTSVAATGTLRQTLASRAFLLISLVSFTQFVGRTGALFALVPLLGDEVVGLSASQIGFAVTVVNLIMIGTVYFSGLWADRFGRKPVIAPASVIAGLGLVIFAFSTSFPVYLIAAAVWGLGAGISGPAPAAYVADLAPPELRASVFGYFRSMADVGYIVGPPVLTWMASTMGYATPLLITGGMIAVAGALFWVLAPEFHLRTASAAVPAEAEAS